jgi:hypothetical protein
MHIRYRFMLASYVTVFPSQDATLTFNGAMLIMLVDGALTALLPWNLHEPSKVMDELGSKTYT